MKPKRHHIHAGALSLIEAGIVIMLVMLIAAGMVYMRNSTNNLEYNATATQLNTVTTAATNYIHDHYPDLSKNVTTGHPVFVSGQQLRDAGYLMAGYSLTNNSHQDYQLAVAVNPKFSSKLVAFVLTQNGTTIPYDGLRTITAYAGGMAGYVHDDNIAEGAYGGWKVTLTDYGLSAKSGHLASFISSDKLGNSADAGDRLYRYSVDGHPGLNQMKTSIDMDQNNVNNVATVNSGTINATGDVTSKNIIASDTVNTNILVASGDVRANGNVQANGTVTGGAVRANGRLSTGEVLQLDQVNTAGAACSPNGLISRDANGGALSCVNGVWAVPGGGWKLPPPQTIQCSLKYYSAGHDYTRTFLARVDGAGNFWSGMAGDDGIPRWVEGPTIIPDTYDGPTTVMVSVSGLQAFTPIPECSTYSHNETHCDYPQKQCAAAWTYN